MGFAWGVAGIVFATSIARLLTNFWYEPHILHREVFKTSSKGYFVKVAKYCVVAVVAGAITYFIANLIPYMGFVSILCKVGICVVIPNLILLVCFCKAKEFKEVLSRAKGLLKIKAKV